MKKSILEATRVIRSKNSGPFELTLDIMFRDKRLFDLFRSKGIVSKDLISRLYGVTPDEILGIVWFEPAHAVKATIRRRIPSGAVGDTDIYGAQQHAPLLTLEYDDEQEEG
jgi:hypothetical protein